MPDWLLLIIGIAVGVVAMASVVVLYLTRRVDGPTPTDEAIREGRENHEAAEEQTRKINGRFTGL